MIKLGDSIKTLKNIHGIPNIFESKNLFLKLWWTILTFASASVCIFFIRKTLFEYLRFHVTTEVRLNETNEMEFPSITLCNSNKFSTNYSLNYLNKLKKTSNDSVENFLEHFKLVRDLKWHPASKILLEKLNFTNELYLRRNLTLTSKEMILSCQFDLKNCNNLDFEWIFNARYGNCYRFNSNVKKPKSSIKSSMFYGLNLVLNLQNENSELDELNIGKGVYVSIDDQTSNPYGDFDDVIFVSAGQQTNIQIDKSIFYKQPDPYSTCLDQVDLEKSEFYDKIKQSNLIYSQSICLSFCFDALDLIECKCIQAKSSHIAKYQQLFPKSPSFCSNKTQFDCIENFHLKNDLNQNYCLNKCPLECKRVKYNNFVSSFPFDSEIILHFFRQNQKSKKQDELFEPKKENFLALNIYFGSMSFVQYKEYPSVSIYSLISSLGGHMGLFLGMSLLSLNEIFELLLRSIGLLFNLFYLHNSKKKIKSVKNDDVQS